MVIMMKLNAPQADVEKVKEKILAENCKAHLITGSFKIAIGVTGQTNKLSEEEFLTMDSVEDVVRVSKPYKLVSREMKSQDTIINIDDSPIGGQ